MSTKKKTSFKDADNRDWLIRFSVGKLRAIKEKTGYNLADTQQFGDLFSLLMDPEQYGEVLWMLVSDQASSGRDEVTKDQFLDAVDADTRDRSWEALVGEIVNFTPAQTRDAAEALMDKIAEHQQRAIEKMMNKLDGTVDQAMERKTDEIVEEAVSQLIG